MKASYCKQRSALMVKLSVILLLAGLLIACGKKGDLFLPEEKAHQASQNAQIGITGTKEDSKPKKKTESPEKDDGSGAQ